MQPEWPEGYVYQVFWSDWAAAPNRRPFDLIETEFPTMQSLYQHLQAGGAVAAAELVTRWGSERGQRVVVRRAPCIFTLAAVARMIEPTWSIVEGGSDEPA